MSTIINGTSSAITFPDSTVQNSAGLAAGGTIATGTITTLTTTTLNSTSGVLATQNGMTGIAKAWVQFGGTTPTINGSFNVGSITKNSAGDYTINFTTTMANANYSVIGSASINTVSNVWPWVCTNTQSTSPYYSAPTTSSCRIMTTYNTSNTGAVDCFYISVAVLGA